MNASPPAPRGASCPVRRRRFQRADSVLRRSARPGRPGRAPDALPAERLLGGEQNDLVGKPGAMRPVATRGPPSLNTRVIPRPPSGLSAWRRSTRASASRDPLDLMPGPSNRGRSAGAPAPAMTSVGDRPAVAARRERREVADACRARRATPSGRGRLAHGQQRVVAERRADADHDASCSARKVCVRRLAISPVMARRGSCSSPAAKPSAVRASFSVTIGRPAVTRRMWPR